MNILHWQANIKTMLTFEYNRYAHFKINKTFSLVRSVNIDLYIKAESLIV